MENASFTTPASGEQAPLESCSDEFADVAARAPNQIQLVRATDSDRAGGRLLAKAYRAKNGLLHKLPHRFPSNVVPMALSAHDLSSAVACLKRAEADGYCMLLGALNTKDQRVVGRLEKHKHVSRTTKELKKKDGSLQLPCFVDAERHLFAIDFDPTSAQRAWCKTAGLDVYADPEGAVRACVEQFLPEEVQRCAYAYQLSAGAGLSKDEVSGGYIRDPARVKFHVFVWLKTPRMPSVVKAWVQARDRENIAADFGDVKGERGRASQSTGGLDLALYQAVQPHFISTRFEGCKDPLAGKRWGIMHGDELDLEEVSYVDERLEGAQVARESIRAIESRCGQRLRRAITQRNGMSVNAMPRGWRERLSLMAPGRVNEVIKVTTWALARELEAEYGVFGANSESVKRAYLDEIFAQVIKTPGNRTTNEVDKHRADIDRLFEDALPQVAARRAEREAIEAARNRIIPPLYPDNRVPLEEGEAQCEASIGRWFVRAREARQAKVENHANYVKWDAAGRRMPENRSVFPYPLRIAPPHLMAIAGETGLGKTRGIIKHFLASGLHNKERLFVVVPNHDKAEELKLAYLASARDAGIENAPVFVFKGLDRACGADTVRKDAALACATMGLSPRKSACVGCPLRNKCDWIAQSSETGPGLKIIVSAYLGVSIPGIGRAEEEKAKGAPILGFIIDERYEQSLMHSAVLLASEFPAAAFYNNDAFCLSRSDKQLLDDGVKLLRRALRKNGFLQLRDFDAITEHLTIEDGDWVLKIDVICARLQRIIDELKRSAAAEIKTSLADGRKPEVEKHLKPARTIANIRAALDMIRTCHSARSAVEGSADVRACRVLRGANSGERALRMRWMKRLPEMVALSSVLLLNATTSRERCNLPFALRDVRRGNDFLPDIDFVAIKLRPKCKNSQFLLKILNAPAARHHFDNGAYEVIDQSQAGPYVAEIKRRGRSKTFRRLRADAKWVFLLNFIEAIVGRAIADGGSAGLITYKGVAAYLMKYRPLDGVIHGHFGAIAGLNTWENADVLIVVGRNMPSREALIDETEAIFALDPEGRRPDHDAMIPKVTQGLRVEGSADGVPCRAEVPTCPLVNDVYVELAVGETVQAIGRARGVRRPEERPVLIIDISDTVPDLTYDAVIDWDDIHGTTELAAVLHSTGVLPEKPADLSAVAPQHFSGMSGVRQTACDLRKRTKSAKRSLGPMKRNGSITSIGDELRLEDFVQLTVQRALAGSVSNQRLLTPATPEIASYQTASRSRRVCLVDSKRRGAAGDALRSALNSALISETTRGPTARRAAHRPRHENPSPAALRMRLARARQQSKQERE